MTKHYFELDKVESITLTCERETDYKWYPEIPARPKTFLGINYGMHSVIPAGWCDYELEDQHYGSRKQSSYFKDHSWYRVDEVNMKIYNKAHVHIYLSYKHSLAMTFDSNEEAQEYVDYLIASSDKEFHVIINK